jgi:putative tryptophan/tyrosine transport system substrate-binding protein
LAARDATTTIPIVGVDFESDPVTMGFVHTLAHPGGNITGVFLDLPELGGKQMELLREVFPQITRVAIMGDPGINATQFSATENAARVFGIQPEAIAVRVLRDFETALENAASNQAEAGVLLSSPLVFGHMREVVALITAKRFPVISLFSEFPRTGGFMAYGPSVPESFRRCGSYVGRILQGAKPSELPIERPERFELVVNARTAKTFGITVPSLVLARPPR